MRNATVPVSAPATYPIEIGTAPGPRPERSKPVFTFVAQSPREAECLERGDLFAAARAFLEGRLEVRGDLLAALRFVETQKRRGWRSRLGELVGRLDLRPQRWWQSRARAQANIEHHYDHPTEFYRQFLDSRMVYSCAYFEDPQWPLERAQLAKLDLICRKLEVHAGERFLDVGCGWGALVAHAAAAYGAVAAGCTLSRKQFDAALARLAGLGSRANASMLYLDYRDLTGRYDKIASVGMFEHVGLRRLGRYFGWMERLLAPEGRFLNHGIARPEGVKTGAEWRVLQREVFPGGELPSIAQVLHQAERQGFEVLDVENLRPHYALTCRAWVENLQAHAAECLSVVSPRVYRTWLLYLAASAVSFEDGFTDVYQVLMAKRSCPRPRRYHRKYMYA